MLRPLHWACLTTVNGVAQITFASAVSAVIAKYLDGSFPIDGSATLEATCALSMRTSAACTSGYVTTTFSILISSFIIGLQCAAAEGRSGLGFFGPMLSALGFIWWTVYAATITSAAGSAGSLGAATLSTYRWGVVGLSWATAALFLLAFFICAAAAAAATRDHQDQLQFATSSGSGGSSRRCGSRRSAGQLLRITLSKRFNQPLASPPISPAKSNRSYNGGGGGSGAFGAYEAFESSCESPKKWAQPPLSPRVNKAVVTSDGLRTLLVLGGEAVPLSPNPSPRPSPTHRSPMHRSLTAAAGGSSGVGTFSNVVMVDTPAPADQ